MKRTFSKDAEYVGSAAHAIKLFCKRYPEARDFEEVFEWMGKTGHDFFCDNRFADGAENKDWCYALHLDFIDGCGITKDGWYIAIILRDNC